MIDGVEGLTSGAVEGDGGKLLHYFLFDASAVD